ncbi:hypothetical protein B0J12DRAFT_704720 [Macrophomina phaseolina]|uniref:C2H2-type domain-containing protein n=1 Tax=Macrophomina phaseolina TaxID=35725 RepID=A0ABQ8FU93_9PEZI|nr:hypothetical protein B0J12DRAFT_704720 [Macrophomina phaseolina]
MALQPEDEMMADFIPLQSEDAPQGPCLSGISATAHFHEIHPEVEIYEHKCVCGRYFKELKNMRTHQKATGHGACVCGENFSSYPELHRHRYEAVHFVRCTCDRIFGSTQHLRSHQRLEEHVGYRDTKKGSLKTSAIESDTLNEVLCPCGGQLLDDGSSDEPPLRCECGRVFEDKYGPPRDSYDPATTVFTCCNCGRDYDTWDEMWQHQLFMHHPCIACHRIFICEARLMRHQRATGHCHCAACGEHFMTPDRLRQHLLDTHRVDRATVFQDALDERLTPGPDRLPTADPTHPPVYKGGFKSGKNFLHLSLRCRVCGTEFTSPKTLHDHRTRGWHDPFTQVRCPFTRSCDLAAAGDGDDGNAHSFASVSGLLHHLEASQCRSGITLADLNDALRGGALERFVLEQYHFRPTPRNPCDALSDKEIFELCERQVREQEEQQQAGHGDGQGDVVGSGKRLKLKCPLCAPHWKTYPTVAQLKAHLVMYNHTPRFLRYPEYVRLPPTKSKRKQDFGAWSGLAHSLETLLCAGEIEGVQRALDEIEEALRRLGSMEEGGLEEADMVVD